MAMKKRVLYAQTTGPRAMLERTLDELVLYCGVVMTRREVVESMIVDKRPMSEIVRDAFGVPAVEEEQSDQTQG